ncbi:MAG: helix-turn-helix domain-containing protein [Bacteroidales bacterium]|nr:helix-turn-helix domain-containing protein [Bacteroidales bacterium]
MVEKALGKNYFTPGKLPINFCRVNRKQGISHNHDLTEILHYHDFTEIIIILQGNSIHFVEGNEYVVSAGDIFVLQGYQAHTFKDAKNLEIINVMFDANANPEMLDEETFKKIPGYNALFILEPQYRNRHHFNHILHLDRKDLAKIEFIINTMFLEQNSEEPGYETIIKNKLEELIIYLSREYSKLKSREAVSLLRIGSIIEYLETHHSDEINLDLLAQMSFMSVRNFQRVFKKATGQSPIDYLIHIRLQKSKLMLRESNLQVADIALQTGFSEYNYFSRKFKKAVGISPLKYRMRFKPGSS